MQINSINSTKKNIGFKANPIYRVNINKVRSNCAASLIPATIVMLSKISAEDTSNLNALLQNC